MELHHVDVAIIVSYLLMMVVVGFLAERRARGGLHDYFLGGNKMPWWVLSMSNATTMFDISGTMWLVSLLYVYGLKSVFIPWLWPVFNQIFLMVYLSAWLRRSGALTGAEWITLRFGADRGAEASRISVVLFALVSVIGFTGYAFVGIAKFASVFLPPVLSPETYALIIIGVTTLYTVVGGLYSVVIADVIQFVLKIICCIAIGFIAMRQVSPESLAAAVPKGWADINFGWMLDLDWSQLLPAAQHRIADDGYSMFGAFFLMMLFKGVLVSMAGPAPNYDMQRILAARNPREAAMMSGLVTVVLFTPRYFMIAGITALALVLLRGTSVSGGALDLEQVLPIVIRDYVPAGLSGLLIAGFIAAFMSTFSGTINAAAAYAVNDLYKQYLRPAAGSKRIYPCQLCCFAGGRGGRMHRRLLHQFDRRRDPMDRLGPVGRIRRREYSQMALVAAQRLGIFLGNDGGTRRSAWPDGISPCEVLGGVSLSSRFVHVGHGRGQFAHQGGGGISAAGFLHPHATVGMVGPDPRRGAPPGPGLRAQS